MATDEQRKVVLKGIQEREGQWQDLDANAALEEIGTGAGLDDAEMAELFKNLVEENYVDSGRVIQSIEAVEADKRNNEVINHGGLFLLIGYNMKLTDKGRAELDK